MAEIRETLVLEERFAGTFGQYLTLAQQASEQTEEMQAALRAATGDAKLLTAAYQAQAAEQSLAAQTAKAQTAEINRAIAAQKQIEQAAHAASNATREFAQSNEMAGAAASSLTRTLGGLVSTYALFNGVRGLADMSSTYAQTYSRLGRMNDGQQTTSELNDMIFAAAMSSRGAYQDTADMVAKLGTLTPAGTFDSSAELVAFVEQLNKQMTLSGTSATGQQAAMLQLTQALSSGVLRGEELNSVLEQTPTIAQSIAKYIQVDIGEMRDLASQGKITADVVKNAMFAAAEETNAAFESMPRTWADVWNQAQSMAQKAFQPVFGWVNSLADKVDDAEVWIQENEDMIIAGMGGVAAAAAVAGGVLVAQGIASVAAWSPLTWTLLAIGAAVAGGIYIAHEFGATYEEILGAVGGGFGALYTYIMNNYIIPTQRGFSILGNYIHNFARDPLTASRILFLEWASAVLGYINKVMGAFAGLSTNVGASYSALTGQEAEWGTNVIDGWIGDIDAAAADLKSQMGWEQRFTPWQYQDYQTNIAAGLNIGRKAGSWLDNFDLNEMWNGMGGNFSEWFEGISDYSGVLGNIESGVDKLNKTVSAADEDIRSLVDMAERRYVNNINLTSQTPVINVTMQGSGNSAMDAQNMARTLARMLQEQRAASASVSTAGAY